MQVGVNQEYLAKKSLTPYLTFIVKPITLFRIRTSL